MDALCFILLIIIGLMMIIIKFLWEKIDENDLYMNKLKMENDNLMAVIMEDEKIIKRERGIKDED